MLRASTADPPRAIDARRRSFGRTRLRPEGVADEDVWIFSQFAVSSETLPTLGMQIAEGRNFSLDRGIDSSGVVLINETAARHAPLVHVQSSFRYPVSRGSFWDTMPTALC